MNELETISIELGTKPIKGDSPTGTNVRYDDEFEFVEDELSKQGSMVDRGLIHWDKVIDATSNILSNKSKDLKVSCYLSRALFENRGFEGLYVGLEINLQLLKIFWDDIYPTKKRARANAYEWLTSKLIPLLENLKPDIDSLVPLQLSYECIQNIELFLNEQLDDDAPALGKLRRLINDLIEPLTQRKTLEDQNQEKLKALQNKADSINPYVVVTNQANQRKINKKSDTAATIDSEQQHISNNQRLATPDSNKTILSPSINNISNTISNAASEKDKNKIMRQCHDALRNLSSWSINQSLDSPSAYAMNRFSTWMAVSKLPVHTNNVTPLKPVPKDKLNNYMNLFNNKSYQELIPQVEQSFSKSPFWLDAHRLVSISLEALGMNESAMQIKEHLAIFIRRFPDLLDLKFSDQTDFADQITKQWINTDVLTNRDIQLNLSIDSDDASTSYDELIKDARELVKQQKLKEAVKLFQNKISNQENLRKKTFWKYHLARFCYDNGEHKISYFLLKEIDGILLGNNLRYWEQDLEKNVVHLLIQSLKNSGVLEVARSDNLSANDEVSEDDLPYILSDNREINNLYSRLCQLDPILALDI